MLSVWGVRKYLLIKVTGETTEQGKRFYNAMSQVLVKEDTLITKHIPSSVLRVIKEYCAKTVFMTRLQI